jgi:hypothetical protein
MIATVLSRSARGGSYTSLLSYLQESVEPARVRASDSILGRESASFEMEAMARAFGSARGPYHFVLSLAPDERVPDAKLLDIAEAASDRLGGAGAAFVASIHDDGIGRCQHVHVALAPVNPETGKKLSFGRDWLVLDRFCRETELTEGLRSERGLYEVRDGEIRRAPRADGVAALSARARDVATWTLQAPFQTWVGDEPSRALAAYLVRPDASWQGVHETLARFGVAYERRRSGAALVTEDVTQSGRAVVRAAKAGHLGSFATLPKLERELGAFRAPDGVLPAPVMTYRNDQEGRRETMRAVLGPQADDLARRYEREREMVGAAQLVRKRRWDAQREGERTRREAIATREAALTENLIADGIAPRLAADVAATAFAPTRKALAETFMRERAAIGRAPRVPLFRTWLERQGQTAADEGSTTTVVAGGSSAALEGVIRQASTDGISIVGANEIAVRRALAIATIERVPVREAVVQPPLPFERSVLVRSLDALGISVAAVDGVGEIAANDLIARHDRIRALTGRGGELSIGDANNPLRHVIFRGLEDERVSSLRSAGLAPSLVLYHPGSDNFSAVVGLSDAPLDSGRLKQLATELASETQLRVECGGSIAIGAGTSIVSVGPRLCDELQRRYDSVASLASEQPNVAPSLHTEASRPPIGEPAIPSRITVQPPESELRIGHSLEAEQRRLTRRFTRR